VIPAATTAHGGATILATVTHEDVISTAAETRESTTAVATADHKITTIAEATTATIANTPATKPQREPSTPAVQTRTVRFTKQEEDQNMEELISTMHDL